jgi:hypothetical protein
MVWLVSLGGEGAKVVLTVYQGGRSSENIHVE